MSYDFQYEEYFIEKGIEVRELMREYGIDIHSFEPGTFIKTWSHGASVNNDGDNDESMMFPFEQGLNEIRLTLGRVYTIENLIDEYNSDNLEEVKNDWPTMTDKNIKDFNDNKEIALKEKTIISNEKATFSVFVEEEGSDIFKISKDPELEEEYFNYCMGKAYNYYSNILMTFNDLNCFDKYHTAFTDEIDDFKTLLINEQVEINNDNLEIANMLSNRLYKDGKFFYELEELIGRCKDGYTYNEFIKDLNML